MGEYSTDEIGILIDLAGRQIYCCGNLINLTALQFDLLVYLFNNSNRVCNYEELLEDVWQYVSLDKDTHIVRIAISRLRKNFQNCSICQGQSLQIRTVRGIGYCLTYIHLIFVCSI